MTTTLVAVGGKGTNPKTTLYVGGLAEEVNEAKLHEAFIPFGDIKDVNIPLDHATGKHRGFGFVEYEDKDDAATAIDNMHNAELMGRVIRVNIAQPMKIKGGDKGWSHLPVWADADQYLEELEVSARHSAHGSTGSGAHRRRGCSQTRQDCVGAQSTQAADSQMQRAGQQGSKGSTCAAALASCFCSPVQRLRTWIVP